MGIDCDGRNVVGIKDLGVSLILDAFVSLILTVLFSWLFMIQIDEIKVFTISQFTPGSM